MAPTASHNPAASAQMPGNVPISERETIPVGSRSPLASGIIAGSVLIHCHIQYVFISCIIPAAKIPECCIPPKGLRCHSISSCLQLLAGRRFKTQPSFGPSSCCDCLTVLESLNFTFTSSTPSWRRSQSFATNGRGGGVLRDLARQSHHWRNITLRIESYFQELDVVRSRVPLLRSLCIKAYELDAGRAINIFQDAPSLRHVSLTVSRNDFWPFGFILPLHQVTSLTLNPIPFPAFSRCLQECPQLLYFNVQISWRQATETVWHISHPCLRKLVMHGSRCRSAIVVHSFPHLLSLRIGMEGELHPGFFAFLAQCSHLEMLLVHNWHSTREDLGLRLQLSVLVATSSLRILRFRNWQQGWYTTIVTSRFWTTAPFAPLLDDPFTPVAAATASQATCGGLHRVGRRRIAGIDPSTHGARPVVRSVRHR
ncbi:hypothetical protein B0H14DRAFT_323675 [Mycena olivaceomarginata]|nr:hypothetical protein B0H14DRAFT_323675 [Mycena olivaceomarginata]